MKWRFWKKNALEPPDTMTVGSDAWKDEKDLLSERELYGHYPESDEDDEPDYYNEEEGS